MWGKQSCWQYQISVCFPNYSDGGLFDILLGETDIQLEGFSFALSWFYLFGDEIVFHMCEHPSLSN